MRYRILFIAFLLAYTLPVSAQSTFFKVRIENVGADYEYISSGVFNTPVGDPGPGPLTPGGTYEFSFAASEGARLSFATMFVQSNDLFFAPAANGLPLWDAFGQPRSENVTAELMLWDAGTEMNEEPGVGMNQAPRQASADTGPTDADNTVRLVNDAFTYPAVGDVIDAELVYDGDNTFTLTITNVSTDQTLPIGGGMSVAVPLAPGVFVVHTDSEMPLFVSGQPEPGQGLEGIAEDGNAEGLGDLLADQTGVTTIFAPGVWSVHRSGALLFDEGQMDTGEGLEKLAEDGDPHPLHASLSLNPEISAGVFSIPPGYGGPAPAFAGSSYEFTVIADPGDHLSFATMFVESNDYFVAPGEDGIALFDGSDSPVSGDVTSDIDLWDAGTEANEIPGVGPNQAPRQNGGNTGAVDPTATVRHANDAGMIASDIARVTITPMQSLSLNVTIENVSTDMTLMTSTNATLPVPLAPGVFAVHTSSSPFFAEMDPDRGLGLEGIAEDGDPSILGPVLDGQAGITSGVFNTPDGEGAPGPLLPGATYSFTVDAAPGAYLSLATMFVQSNDLFYAPSADGMALWDESGFLKTGDVTGEFLLWDAGTELNEEPGEGMNQAPRQASANTGPVDTDPNIRLVSDMYTYPEVSSVIRVTIEEATPTYSDDGPDDVPFSITLAQNYPNPFNPRTLIDFELNQAGPVRLTVFDVLGREIRVLADGGFAQGIHSVAWDGLDGAGNPAATGIYLYQLETSRESTTRTMTLLR